MSDSHHEEQKQTLSIQTRIFTEDLTIIHILKK